MNPSTKVYLIFFVVAVCADDWHGLLPKSLEEKLQEIDPGNFPLQILLGGSSRCPNFNTLEYSPRCGSDGKTYGNSGALKIHNCRTGQKVTVKHSGPCGKRKPNAFERLPKEIRCNIFCMRTGNDFIDPMDRDQPLCGSDGKTYKNWCTMCKENDQLSVKHEGPCKKEPGTKRCSNTATVEYRPRCGSDGKTYGNSDELKNHNCWTGEKVTVKHSGPCDPCTVFSNACTMTSKDFSNPRDINQPLCGSNGKTYKNMCTMCDENKQLFVKHKGPCKKKPGPGAQFNTKNM